MDVNVKGSKIPELFLFRLRIAKRQPNSSLGHKGIGKNCRSSSTAYKISETVDEMQMKPSDQPSYPTVEDCVGNTPLVKLQRLNSNPSNIILCKLEGDNPAGSVKDRPAVNMIAEAEANGQICPGDTIIEATSGNTGIALAMAAAIKEERRAAMAAYGAELITVPPGNMEMARDLAKEMEARGDGIVLDQFGNQSNPSAHYKSTGPELWAQTGGRITHFVSSMGTTGTIMGVSRFLKEKNPQIRIVGLQPADCSSIAGIRRWPHEYLPKIFDETRVDEVLEISQREAEETMRALAKMEGIFAGVSSGGAVSAALRLSSRVQNATICVIVCDRGDRYLSSGVFSEAASSSDPQPCPVEEMPSLLARRSLFPQPHYVLFTADLDPATGRPWCPDCDRSLEAIRETVRASKGTLFEIQVGTRSEWKAPGHQLRADSTWKLSGIPTLCRLSSAGQPEQQLSSELENAETLVEIERLLKNFVTPSNSV